MKTITITIDIDCKHKNGWFNRIYIKLLWFRISKLYFFCEDCKQAIDKIDLI
jgi:hypothetical protein